MESEDALIFIINLLVVLMMGVSVIIYVIIRSNTSTAESILVSKIHTDNTTNTTSGKGNSKDSYRVELETYLSEVKDGKDIFKISKYNKLKDLVY